MERLSRLGEPDMVILPGTANRRGDMVWLKDSGLWAAIRERVPVLEVRTPGMFDSGETVEELADRLLERKGLPPMRFCPLSYRDYLEEQFDLLAQTVRENLDLPAVCRAMEKYERGTSL